MFSRLRWLAVVTAALVVLAGVPGAQADPEPAAPPPDTSTLALAELGASNTIWFDARRDISSSTFSFVVPEGLTPVSLNATLEVPINLRFGNLTVTQNGRTISRMMLPPDDQAPIVIPLAGVETFDNWASVTLTVTAVPVQDTYCWDPRAPIRLVNGAIAFTGAEVRPGTVAAFLPPTLRRLSIGLPAQPSRAESDAAVQLAAISATRYGWLNTDIAVVALPDGASALPNGASALPGPYVPQERQLVIKEGPDTGLSLLPGTGVPALLVSGPGTELTDQVRLLMDPALPFALSGKAVAGQLASPPPPAGDAVSLAQLKQTGLSAESLRPEVGIKLDQSRFGHSLTGIRVHLIGSYTPLPTNFNGEVTAAIGDDIIDRWPVNTAGTIDRWVDVPNQLVRRASVLTIRVHTTGDPGHCNDYLNMALRIDPSTVITANRASPPVPPGFGSLPAALLPRVQVGIGTDAFGDTVRAAKIVVGLQRTSGVPLLTAVTDLQQAVDGSDPAILIAADGWNQEKFALPFSADQGRITIDGLDPGGNPVTLTLEPEVGFGSLQTLFDGQRSILVATSNGVPGQLDELLRWLAERPSRWPDLEGRAIISVPGSPPVTVPNRKTDVPLEPSAAEAQHAGDSWVWWAAGAVAVLALGGAGLILARTRTPKAGDRNTEGPDPGEPDPGDRA